MSEGKSSTPWFVRIKGRGRYQIKPYGWRGWALTGAWGISVCGLMALLAFPYFLERFWIPAGLALGVTAVTIVIGCRRSVPVERLVVDRESNGLERREP